MILVSKRRSEVCILRWLQRAGKRLGAIALLAMLVRAIVPAGYMVAAANTSGERYLTITFCEAHTSAPRVLDLKSGRFVDPSQAPAKQSKHTDHVPCVCATVMNMAPPVEGAEPAIYPVSYLAVGTVLPVVRPGEGIAAPPPPSTGPPSR